MPKVYIANAMTLGDFYAEQDEPRTKRAELKDLAIASVLGVAMKLTDAWVDALKQAMQDELENGDEDDVRVTWKTSGQFETYPLSSRRIVFIYGYVNQTIEADVVIAITEIEAD